MAIVTQPSERPGLYQESFNTTKKQMMGISKLKKKFSSKEMDIMIKFSLIEKAKDKVEFSLKGEIRRGGPKKKGMSEEEFSTLWKSKMRDRLKRDGFPFVMSPPEQKILKEVQLKIKQEAASEMAMIASEAMKKVLMNV